MNAKEFIKQYGWEESKGFYYWASENKSNFASDDFKLTVFGGSISYLDLKQLVDAWELVEYYGGLKESNERLFHLALIGEIEKVKVLNKAIELVGSVNV